MAKLSLSHILKRKKRVRLLTVCSTLLLLFAIVSIITSKNPWGAKAVVYPTGFTYDEATKTLTISSASGCTSGVGDPNRCILYGADIPQVPGKAQGIMHYDPSGNVFVPIDNDTSLILSGLVSISTYSLDDATPVRLKNLTISGQNAAKTVFTELTHDALSEGIPTDPNIDQVDRSTLTPWNGSNPHTNLWRRINLQIDGNLNLLDGGRINADAKGYPGGAINNDGWGIGRGTQHSTCGDNNPGAGGSYGGKGGSPIDGTLPSFVPGGICPSEGTYDTQENPQWWGSGGAGGKNGAGGAGGGRVKIIANNISVGAESGISANAKGFGTTEFNSGAGTGSGGSVYIKTNYIEFVKNWVYNISVEGGANWGGETADLKGGSGGGGRIAVYTCASNVAILNIKSQINASQGQGNENSVVGEIGTAYVSQVCNQQVSIKKMLLPKSRLGAPLNDPGNLNATSVFNPYALKKDDIIGVQLEIENLVPGLLHIEDEVLTVPNSDPRVFCDLNHTGGTPDTWELWWDDDGNIAPTSYDGNKIVVDKNIEPNETKRVLTYWCKVMEQQP